MTDPAEAMREAAREVLRELLPGMLDEVLGGSDATGEVRRNGSGNESGNGRHPAPAGDPVVPLVPPPGGEDVVPLVPAPPVAAVLRPSTWSGPQVPGEVVGEGSASPIAPSAPAGVLAPGPAMPIAAPAPDGTSAKKVEAVTIDSDEDLDRFVRALFARFENPRDRRDIRGGRLRFVLRHSGRPPASPANPGPTSAAAIRVEKGAVTERAVRAAAAQGARIILGRGAVLTPLARDQARALQVQIEKER